MELQNLSLIIKDNIIKTLYNNDYTPYQLKQVLRIIKLINLSNERSNKEYEN